MTAGSSTLGGATSRKDGKARALFWTLLDVGGSQGLSFLLYVVLTRILTPEDYGIFALSLSVVAVTNIILFQGFADALIQREHPDEDDCSTVFWINFAIGLGLGLLLLAAAGPLAELYGAPLLRPVLQVMSVLCPLRALVSVHSALCRREMRMSIFAMRAIGAYLIGGAAGVALALQGWGVWALVACQLVQAATILVVMWSTIRWVPRLRFSGLAFHRLAGFGRQLMLASVLGSAADKVDNLIIGLVLGPAAVGYYSLAMKVFQAVGLVTIQPLNLLVMPILARLAHHKATFSAEYVRLVTACLAVWLPAVAGLGVLAPVVLPLAFGPQWADAVPVLQAICVSCASMPFWALSGQALSALGRPDLYIRLAAAQLVLAALAFAAAAPFGIVAVGFAWAAVSALLVPLNLATMVRATGVRPHGLQRSALRLLLCAAGMAAVMLLLFRLVPHQPWLAAITAPFTYLALLALLLPGYPRSLLRSARHALPLPGKA
ncbi:lipopolysaccharide biosynthesis protein [Roseomonas sp. E05]|uniref:lipopolysaccharide biosynthesis protein n=1 Tax=Roseomonas sp. E05 TaxID=3046310 RepID=UPI0024B9B5CD|nr:lipopolysaccharide biosynthesis protein [Roseomonas sp. E05]MDJ0390003.1 lipopolysaccharide biosynthesis protein [Roseomonas sp. E05]